MEKLTIRKILKYKDIIDEYIKVELNDSDSYMDLLKETKDGSLELSGPIWKGSILKIPNNYLDYKITYITPTLGAVAIFIDRGDENGNENL